MAKWRDIAGFEGLYAVSSDGRVWSYRADRCLSPGDASGYAQVTLTNAGVVRQVKVHVLVLEAFRGPRPAGLLGRHKDGNSWNNTLRNLEWATARVNQHDRRRHGTHLFGDRNPRAKVNRAVVDYIRTCGKSTAVLIRETRLSQAQIDRIKRGVSWPERI